MMVNSHSREMAAQRAALLMTQGYHCSEAIFIAVGEQFLDEITEPMIRMSTPFAGGVGGQHIDICGALTGGLMVIGALRGRTNANINDDDCQSLAADFRNAFQEKFGSVICADLRQGACGELTRQASLLLMNMLDEAG